MMKNRIVFFVSTIRPFNKNMSSTDIMTSSLLKGISDNGCKVVFFAICEYGEEADSIRNYYSKYANSVVLLPSKFGNKISKFKMLLKLLHISFFSGFYKKRVLNSIKKTRFAPDYIISHSPSIESIYYSRAIKLKYPASTFIQFWSDPIALSGINPNQYSFKRFFHKLIESRALRSADKIVYGTRTLKMFQEQLFPTLSKKMKYIDIPYVEKNAIDESATPKTILYAGNYFKEYRNLNPLVDAIESMDGYTLDIYGCGELDARGLKNTFLHSRVSSEELTKLEGKYEYLVCVLNHNCIQIPGKIFYDMSRKVKILVIADGDFKDELCSYLLCYNRFIICNNNSLDIKAHIQEWSNKKVDLSFAIKTFSPKKMALCLIDGGLD